MWGALHGCVCCDTVCGTMTLVWGTLSCCMWYEIVVCGAITLVCVCVCVGNTAL